MGDGAVTADWYEFRDGFSHVLGEVIEETLISIYVNGQELATLMATPREQKELALGFLKNEGFIAGFEAVELIYLSAHGCCVDVWLNHDIIQPGRGIITSGCGGGITFRDPEAGFEPLKSSLTAEPEELMELFGGLQRPDSLYARARGVHAAAISDGRKLLASAEDVGRHNTIDKLLGICMQRGIDTREKMLLVTGRISSEMLVKSATMGCPIVASRNSPTSLSVNLARELGITLIGYVRRQTMRIYSFPERLQGFAGKVPLAADLEIT
ncbi:MAG: formate dehydrogenase accessory sulfurtransferase FdhD [Anaerolineales bacterium]|jgi:FdhD protein